jgi:hypothetical protein
MEQLVLLRLAPPEQWLLQNLPAEPSRRFRSSSRQKKQRGQELR